MIYKHTQHGWLMFYVMGFLTFGILGFAFYKTESVSNPAVWITPAILILALLNFYSLTVTVNSEKIQMAFGIGLIRFNIKPEHITSVTAVKTTWLNGWGIRFTSEGMLYNVSGYDAIRIQYIKGKSKTVLIGTNDPQGLKAAIEANFEVK